MRCCCCCWEVHKYAFTNSYVQIEIYIYVSLTHTLPHHPTLPSVGCTPRNFPAASSSSTNRAANIAAYCWIYTHIVDNDDAEIQTLGESGRCIRRQEKEGSVRWNRDVVLLSFNRVEWIRTNELMNESKSDLGSSVYTIYIYIVFGVWVCVGMFKGHVLPLLVYVIHINSRLRHELQNIHTRALYIWLFATDCAPDGDAASFSREHTTLGQGFAAASRPET